VQFFFPLDHLDFPYARRQTQLFCFWAVVFPYAHLVKPFLEPLTNDQIGFTSFKTVRFGHRMIFDVLYHGPIIGCVGI
jgi:hypothetical protein